MRPQVVVETVKQSFPELGVMQIANEMDNQEQRFARETNIIRDIGNLATLTSKAFWALPTGFLELYEVELYDSAYAPLHKVDEDIDWFIDDSQLRFYSTDGTEISTIPTSISYILTRYSKLPTTAVAAYIVTNNAYPTAFAIDEQFSEAILAGTLSAFYGRIPKEVPVMNREGNVTRTLFTIDRNSRDYWEVKYERLKIEAKKWMNTLDSTERRSRNYQHAGLYSLPKEHTDATLVAAATSWT
jgi:hypothetical protein